MRFVLACMGFFVAGIIAVSYAEHDRKDDPAGVVWVPPAPQEIDSMQYHKLNQYIAGHPMGRAIGKKYMEDGKITDTEMYAIYLETERAEFEATCEQPISEPPK